MNSRMILNWITPMLMALVLIMLTGCGGDDTVTYQDTSKKTPAPDFKMSQPPQSAGQTGKVVETMDSGGYTYVCVDVGGKKVWAASRPFPVKVGETVTLPADALIMPEFHSDTLNRTFKQLMLCPSIAVEGRKSAAAASGLPEGHPKVGPGPVETAKIGGIDRPEGGRTVAEIYAEKDALAGKDVLFRGKVVRFNPNIMNRNWLHVQDGSGAAGANDLAVTTSATVKVGDTVLVKGKVLLNQDFGYGYKYDLLVENAEVTVEGKK